VVAALISAFLRRLRTRALSALRALSPARRQGGQYTCATNDLTARFEEQLSTAADAAISLARRDLYHVIWRPLSPAERLAARGEVTIGDVATIMQLRYGIIVVPREPIAAALRTAYEARSGRIDLKTDAYTIDH
jgi:hypothetical protein